MVQKQRNIEQANIKAVHSLWEEDIKNPTVKLDNLDDSLDDSASEEDD
jgi:hypothetical protein